MVNIQKFFSRFKFFCLMGCASICVILIILLFRQKLVSDDAFRMGYPEVVFENDVMIDKDLAIVSIRDLITPYLEAKTLMQVDVKKLQTDIAILPWVKNVAVVRDYPDVVKIVIKSKEIIAYKVVGGNYYPIVKGGEVLKMPVDYLGGVLVFGDKSEENLEELLLFLNDYPSLLNKLVGVQFINELRWNLIFYDMVDGLVVKLDNSYENGIMKLAELDVLQGILSRNISDIDLRDLEKILVKKKVSL